MTTGNMSSITTVGTVTSGTWSAGTIATNKGGTNLTAFTANGLMYASSASVLATSSNISTDGSKFTKYNNLTTAGTGVPIVVYASNNSYEAQQSDVGPITMASSGSVFRVSWYLFISFADAEGRTCQLKIDWNDGTARQITSSALSDIGGGFEQGVETIYRSSGNLTFTMDFSATMDVSHATLYIFCERLY